MNPLTGNAHTHSHTHKQTQFSYLYFAILIYGLGEDTHKNVWNTQLSTSNLNYVFTPLEGKSTSKVHLLKKANIEKSHDAVQGTSKRSHVSQSHFTVQCIGQESYLLNSYHLAVVTTDQVQELPSRCGNGRVTARHTLTTDETKLFGKNCMLVATHGSSWDQTNDTPPVRKTKITTLLLFLYQKQKVEMCM